MTIGFSIPTTAQRLESHGLTKRRTFADNVLEPKYALRQLGVINAGSSIHQPDLLE